MANSVLKIQTNQRDVSGVAVYRSRRSVDVSALLATAARDSSSLTALGVADRLRSCGGCGNLWAGRDLHREEDGECYDGVGNLWACGSRLCPSCSANLRRRSRSRARSALAVCTPAAGELWRFVTLTAPTLPGQSLLSVRAVFDRAWVLFRKREFWASSVRAGVKGEEFTVNRDGYHYHIHILALSNWLQWSQLRAEWTECLQTAWRERGLTVEIATASGQAVVDVRLVRARRRGARGATISLEGALNEVTKYITKSESWDKLPPSHLVEIAEVPRWPRMFEVFGDARQSHQAESDKHASDVDETSEALARCERSRLLAWVESWDTPTAEAMVNPEVLALARREQAALEKRVFTSLDTQSISDGGIAQKRPPPVRRMTLRARGPTLRELSITLERESWLKILAVRVHDVQRYRKAMLIRRFPYATFTTLAGEVFGADVE